MQINNHTIRFCVITPDIAQAFLEATTNDDQYPSWIFAEVSDALNRVDRITRRQDAAGCTLCNGPVWRNAQPAAIVIVLYAETCLTAAICTQCNDTPDNLRAALLAKLQNHWPNLKLVNPHTGHA